MLDRGVLPALDFGLRVLTVLFFGVILHLRKLILVRGESQSLSGVVHDLHPELAIRRVESATAPL